MKRIIIDADPGIDDYIAILTALKCPALNVLGITIASGNVSSDKGAVNALRAIEAAGTYRPPVLIGSSAPLQKPYCSAEETHGGNGLGNAEPDYTGAVTEGDGVSFLLNAIRENPNELTICALGPLTNIALAIQKDADTAKLVKEIVIMGGVARNHGNCSPVAEFNFYCDPHAAAAVFESGIPIVMVGLDVTYGVLMTPNARELFRQWNTPLSNRLFQITQKYVDFHWEQEKTLGCVINDPLVSAYLINESVLELYDGYVKIVTEGAAEGQSMVDFNCVWGSKNAKIAMSVDAYETLSIIYKTIFPEFAGDIDILLDFDFLGKRHGFLE